MVLRIDGHECPACYLVHDQENKARECCPVQKVDQWECELCGTWYLHEDEAETCELEHDEGSF